MEFQKNCLRLYAVTDRSWLRGGTLYEQVEQALNGGATLIQLREKALDTERFIAEARQIKSLCEMYKVPFIINDNVEVALAVDAGILGYHMYQCGQQFYGGDGIVTKGVEKTILNVGRLGKQGMRQTNEEIIKIMTEE